MLDGAFLLEYIRIHSLAAVTAGVVLILSVVGFEHGVAEEGIVYEMMLHRSMLKYIPGLSKGLAGENLDLCDVSPRSSIHAI